MSLETEYVRSQFSKKGFKIENDGNDYYCRYYYSDIRTNIRTKIGGHSKIKYKIFPDKFISKMWKYLYFDNKDQLLDFIDCPFSQTDYHQLLIKKDKIRP